MIRDITLGQLSDEFRDPLDPRTSSSAPLRLSCPCFCSKAGSGHARPSVSCGDHPHKKGALPLHDAGRKSHHRTAADHRGV